jgi:prepilin-type N-terminal cleavage/methylation domain-containing protein
MRSLSNNRGLTLVELLIVMALTGIVAAAILNLLLTTQRTASSSEEVVEVQQNLRFALGQMTHDLRMAGFMVNREQRALDLALDRTVTLRTASAESSAARVTAGQTLESNEATFSIANAAMVNLLAEGDQVRILRPQDQTSPITPDQLLTVVSTSPSPPELTLALDGATGTIVRGDLIVRSETPAINTVTYCLDPDPGCGPAANPPCPPGHFCIKRVVNGTFSEIIASQIAPNGLTFTYFAEDASATADLDAIRAVRIDLTGQTVNTAAQGQAKVRSLNSYVRFRNR